MFIAILFIMTEKLYTMIGDRYLITNCGQIINIKRNHELKPRVHGGYYAVVLYNKKYYVHRLVGYYFLNNNKNEKYIDHKNHNRLDNRSCNLRWVSRIENNRNKTYHVPEGERHWEVPEQEYKRLASKRSYARKRPRGTKND